MMGNVTTIGLDIAKSVFQVQAWMRLVRAASLLSPPTTAQNAPDSKFQCQGWSNEITLGIHNMIRLPGGGRHGMLVGRLEPSEP